MRRTSGSASSNQAARSSRRTPKACCSCGSATPRPKAGSRRPPESTSRLASSLASTAGLRPGSTSTLVPSLRRPVRPAATASPTTGPEATLARLNEQGQLARPIRPVVVDRDGRVDAAEAAGVTALWRPGLKSREWLLAAVDHLPDLAWVHSDAVGVDSLPVAELAARDI